MRGALPGNPVNVRTLTETYFDWISYICICVGACENNSESAENFSRTENERALKANAYLCFFGLLLLPVGGAVLAATSVKAGSMVLASSGSTMACSGCMDACNQYQTGQSFFFNRCGNQENTAAPLLSSAPK